VFKITTQHKGISITLTTHPINHTYLIIKNARDSPARGSTKHITDINIVAKI
jgi:hypothetical protein